jgi:purine-binding chemotaxis protein CheW
MPRMVDLAKIRKKAKKKGTEEAPAASTDAASAPAPAVSSSPSSSSASQSAPTATPAAASTPPAATPAGLSKLEAFKEQAGKRREAEASKAEVAEEARLEHLTFLIAGEQYAIDIEKIVEIVTPRAVTRIPNADASVVGIISLRGTIITLVDVRGKLRHGAAGESTADTRIVVIDLQNEMIGFVVDRVLRVVKTDAGDIEPHPVVHATELDDSIRGVFRANGALTILLDLDKLLDHRWT